MPSYVPTDNLLGWWGFNGNANDETSFSNNGSVYGAILTQDRFGNTDEAYSFDGANDYIEISANNTLIGPTTELSLSAWINLASVNSDKRAVFSQRDTMEFNCDYVYGLWVVENNYLYTEVNGENTISPVQVVDSASLNIDTWYFLTLVVDSSQIQLYIDGALVKSEEVSLGTIDIRNKLARIGRHRDLAVNSQFFEGKIDDVGVWSRALTQCEITALYTTQDCNVGLLENINQPKKLVKQINLLGQDVDNESNSILINIYSDGSTKKVVRLE